MRFHVLSSCIAATFALAAIAPAQAQQNVKVGGLRCEVSAGLGLIITSSKEIESPSPRRKAGRSTTTANPKVRSGYRRDK